MKFDALEDIIKARKAKGLANWKKLEKLSEDLQGKHAAQISFTTCYPGQEGSKKYLGSSSGNLHCLLGYINPAFHWAPYHYRIIDPNITEEEAKSMPHPANPRHWKESGLEMQDEGDFEEGNPHPSLMKGKRAKARTAAKRPTSISVSSGYGRYIAVPEEGRVYSVTNGHVYDWRIVRESYFASTNPELSQKMSEVSEEGPGEEEVFKSLACPIHPFHHEVYPLVKSVYPNPGSVLPLGQGKYAVVNEDHLSFYDSDRQRISVRVFDRVYEEFDLKKGGDVHPSILLNFTVKYLNLDKDSLLQFVGEAPTTESSTDSGASNE